MLRLMVLALAVCMTSASMEANWVIFKAKYNKSYTGDDDLTRRYIWESNVKDIEAHNELYAKGLKSYYLKENKYSDMSHEEFRATMNGFLSNQHLTPGNYSVSGLLRVDLPSAVDWRKEGYVTRVKDQGNCMSGWAFSSTGGLEGQNFKLTGRLVELSESNLIDCSTGWGNHGCQGGSMQKAFQYIIDNKGIDTEESYPYQSEVGPVSAAIDTIHDSFHQYGGGVYDEPDCSSNRLNHGVLVVGYDTDSSGGDYWIVKNSYGTSWGMNGYIWMSRNKDNQCGIATEASYPVV